MHVLAVIVNYRTADLALECLASLAAQSGPRPLRAVVVDNGSGDGSAARIAAAVAQRGWVSWVEVRPLEQNGGFAAGCNAAIRTTLQAPDPPEHYLLVNPDARLEPGALEALAGHMNLHPTVGIAGPLLRGSGGEDQRSARRFPSLAGELEAGLRLGLASRLLARWVVAPAPRAEAHPTDWVPGACMLVRREVFERVGLLDEAFFLYFEEVDLCRRARRAGFECWYVPSARAVHLVGRATGVSGPESRLRRRPRYWFDARSRYFRKHHGRVYKVLADFAWALGFASYRVRQRLQHRPDADPPRLLRDFVLSNLPARRQ
jgi:hypothetical protein